MTYNDSVGIIHNQDRASYWQQLILPWE